MNIVQSSLQCVSPPRAEGPEQVDGQWTFQCLGLKFKGTAQLGNSPPPIKPSLALPASRSPIGMGWRMGWVQVNVQEWYWALYRKSSGEPATLQSWPTYTALDNGDRSGNDLFYQVRSPFYQALSERQPTVVIEFIDLPMAQFKPKLSMQGADALLSDIGVRLSFVCALVVRDPDDALYVLQWIPWYVQWSCEFAPGLNGVGYRKLAAATRAGVGTVQTGVPRVLTQGLANARGPTAIVLADATPTSTLLMKKPDIDAKLRQLRNLG